MHSVLLSLFTFQFAEYDQDHVSRGLFEDDVVTYDVPYTFTITSYHTDDISGVVETERDSNNGVTSDDEQQSFGMTLDDAGRDDETEYTDHHEVDKADYEYLAYLHEEISREDEHEDLVIHRDGPAHQVQSIESYNPVVKENVEDYEIPYYRAYDEGHKVDYYPLDYYSEPPAYHNR